jgi:hypothetical protein
MIIAGQSFWKCGKYSIRQTLRIDNPAFARYLIMRGGKIVGASFSVPDEGWCEFVERFTNLNRYVEKSASLKRYTYRLRGVVARQRAASKA